MKKALLGAGLLGAAGVAATVSAVRRTPYVAPTEKATRVVVLGAGFGGLNAAKTLAAQRNGEDLDVLLVDRYNYHLFTPILYQVATGGVGPDNIAHPVRYVARSAGFRFQESCVERIDLEDRCVYTDDGPIKYDYLVVALGSVTNYFGIADVQEHSLTLKTLGDGISIRNRILDAFERAEVERNPEKRHSLLTFIVVGAGYTGVELITSIRDLVTKVLLKDYPGIRPEDVRVLLVEAIDKVMSGFDPFLSENAVKTMKAKEVEIMLSTPVVVVEPDGILTSSSEFIPSATVIWTAGVRAMALVDDLPGEKGRDGRVSVNEYLQLDGLSSVYVIGDAAMYRPEGEQMPLPANAPVAIAQGRTAALNVLHTLRGEPLEPLHYVREGQLVSLGRSNAVADLRGVKLTGLPGWLAWRLIYVSKLMGAKNRLGVLLDWAFNIFNKRETSRIQVR